MLNFAKLKIGLLYCALMTLPHIAQGRNLDNFANCHCMDQSSDHHFIQDETEHPFKLKNVKGMWVVHFESVGGVDGGKGKSLVVQGIVKLNSHGRGKLKYLEGAVYKGIPGEIGSPSLDIDNLTVLLKIKNSKLGLARLILKDSSHRIKAFNVILRKNRESGEIIEISGIDSSTSFVGSFVLLKQNI